MRSMILPVRVITGVLAVLFLGLAALLLSGKGKRVTAYFLRVSESRDEFDEKSIGRALGAFFLILAAVEAVSFVKAGSILVPAAGIAVCFFLYYLVLLHLDRRCRKKKKDALVDGEKKNIIE